jgi:hypothetical protein
MYEAKYSGPGKSGVCRCGHSWEDHHTSAVMSYSYLCDTHEYYIPEECEEEGCECERYEDKGVDNEKA